MTTSTEYRKTQLTLPQDVQTAFSTLGEDLDTRNLYAATLRRAGWTLASISKATGITRERVRQIAESFDDAVLPPLPDALPVPMPPEKVKRARKAYVVPDPVKLKRLLELQPAAQQNRHNSPANRQAAEDYTALVWEVHNADGVTLYQLAKALGVTHGALRFRLARYGYKLPEKGVSKVYTRIDPAHRVDPSS
ncbi:hypothetical protein SEA_BIG4_369 [Microbacterium phage Big4]|nr:hypothetical protein SEA_BIG4_43 [Microbacterium phage Big4]URP22402.1 hypothetical protein SEA_BIG4_369 [Microbacterium phage Big4]